MIISASRRTDIPAFYAQWLINRIRAGYCTVPNPVNPRQVSRVSLLPEDLDVIVFWTRNPRPLFPYLNELEQRGCRYYFQYTLLGYPVQIDPHSPPRAAAISTFRELAARGKTILIVTHDPSLTSRTDRTIIISDGEFIDPTVAAVLPSLDHPQMLQATLRHRVQ